MNFLKIQNDKLDVTSIQELVSDESCGAISIFVGTTRDNFDDKKVISLEYEAYEPMAIKTMEIICTNLRNKWSNIKHIAIYHRLGIVPVKEASVVIAISSPHRLDSLQSLQYAIDELKRTVPIWKKEKYDNDTTKNHDNVFSRIKRLKKSKFNYNECNNVLNMNTLLPSSSLPKNFIQIGANEDELTRRIQCFIERKREENDLNNILDFIPSASARSSLSNSNGNDTNTEDTCARVNSLLVKRNDSKGHLKVYRVKNEYGPQIIKDYTNALDKLIKSPNKKDNSTIINQTTADIKPSIVPLGIAERLEKIENFFNLPMPVSKDVYQRLKIIENKIQYLETISPEYRHFVDSKKQIKEENIHKRKYTVQDIDNYISIFENKK